MDDLTKTELFAARAIVAEHMQPTPAYSWPLLNRRTGGETWVKHENHTPIGAFKIRGGLVYLTRLKADYPDIAGVLTATRGNHGQSIGLAARRLGMKAVILVPEGNSPEKNAAMEALGVELIVHGRDFQASLEYGLGLAAERGLHVVPPIHPWLVQGVSSYGLELFEAQPDLDTVYVPIGMGSGICGLIAARDALGLTTRIVGVVSERAPCYALSFAAGKVVPTETADTIADGVATRSPDPLAVEMILRGADRIVQVSEEEIMAAMAAYVTDTHNLAEGAGAVPLAALLKERKLMAGKKTGVILSGGNVDRGLLVRVLAEKRAEG